MNHKEILEKAKKQASNPNDVVRKQKTPTILGNPGRQIDNTHFLLK